jgi:hypothetical protein
MIVITVMAHARPGFVQLRKINSINKCIDLPTDIVPPFANSNHTRTPKASQPHVGTSDINSVVPLFNSTQPDGSVMVSSPFKTTMAMVRWNARRMERVPLLMKYQPFFHTVHISMPDMIPEEKMDFHNLTHDQYGDGESIYIQLAHTMKLILDTQPEITGLLYFHFDSWVDPLAFANENPNNIWFPTVLNTRNYKGIHGPRFMCMTDPKDYPWWGWDRGLHTQTIKTLEKLKELGLDYTYKEGEWCISWTDVYYIPRRFFADYIFLSYLFGCIDLFHEVAIPTMLHIIDQSRRSNPFEPILDLLGDCFGFCCDSSATLNDVLWHRCGHRLDYLNKEIVDGHYNRLDHEAAFLGKVLNNTT